MRVFIAIELDNEVKKFLHNVQEEVKTRSLKGNFTRYNNFHLTLKFIGNVTQKQIDNLMNLIDEVASKVQPFTFKISDIGVFKRSNKSIVWLGISKGKNNLQYLSNNLEDVVESYDFEKDNRKFKPHITLAREVVFSDEGIINIPLYDKEIEVNSISLMLSHRVNGVLTYECIYNKKLK